MITITHRQDGKDAAWRSVRYRNQDKPCAVTDETSIADQMKQMAKSEGHRKGMPPAMQRAPIIPPLNLDSFVAAIVGEMTTRQIMEATGRSFGSTSSRLKRLKAEGVVCNRIEKPKTAIWWRVDK